MAKKITPQENCAFCDKQPCECEGTSSRKKAVRKEEIDLSDGPDRSACPINDPMCGVPRCCARIPVEGETDGTR